MEEFGVLNVLEDVVESEDELEINDVIELINDNNRHNCDLREIPRVERIYYLESVIHRFDDRQFQKCFRYV